MKLEKEYKLANETYRWVATSRRTLTQMQSLGIESRSLDDVNFIDLLVDGAMRRPVILTVLKVGRCIIRENCGPKQSTYYLDCYGR